MIIINADDWGRSPEETDRAFECYKNGRITSVTAMVFMEDSARAADLAKKEGMDVGLHLNLSQLFTGQVSNKLLSESHERVARFLTRNKYALLFYNPALRKDFQYVYQAQAEEFLRLYGKAPSHIDGHQHMHLCTNMLIGGILPEGTKVRRSFSFFPGEKSFFNRLYRRWVDGRLSRRHQVTDFFFGLSQQLQPERLARVARLGVEANVEIMTHPIAPKEYELLLGDDYLKTLGNARLESYSSL